MSDSDNLDGFRNSVAHGDAFDVLEKLPANAVHAVVTDPPYGLAFMGRDWDDFEPREYQEWCEDWARKARRVLRPGGHLLAFSGNRTHHRLFCGVEDAGFTVRDTLTWHYGSGFPKALDVKKAVDKKLGEEGEYGEPKSDRYAKQIEYGTDDHKMHEEYRRSWMDDPEAVERNAREYIPATDAAERWDGWRTSLKPATEFIVLARKPLSEGTVAENVLEHGTGALNIDGCRVDHDGADLDGGATSGSVEFTNDGWNRDWMNDEKALERYKERSQESIRKGEELGRYPSNLVLDADAAARLDAEVGTLESGSRSAGQYEGAGDTAYGDYSDTELPALESSSGGPSRYFYTSKASRAERTLDGRIDNPHPTVKPQDLMEWLVRLATREGQIVLDPFAGSGTTLAAAKELGRDFVGVEQDERWADVARVRTGLTPEDPSHVRGGDGQQGLEAFSD